MIFSDFVVDKPLGRRMVKGLQTGTHLSVLGSLIKLLEQKPLLYHNFIVIARGFLFVTLEKRNYSLEH